jgi:glycosyltransferase involved in cell wall biosynthesis
MRTAQSLGRRSTQARLSKLSAPPSRTSGYTAADGRRRLSIIMPAHNEDRTIGAVVNEVLSLEVGFDTELIVVDDGSTDRTPLILGQFDDARLIVHRHADNLGKGAAVMSGAALATGSHLVVFDADGEYVASDLASMFAPIVRGRADVVFGTRMFGMNTVYQSFRYALGNRVTTLAANVLFDSCLTDLHTCLKMMPMTVFHELDLDQKGFALDSEITAELLRRGHRPFEVPVSYHSRSHAEGKKLTWRDGVECLLVLAKVRLRGKPGIRMARRESSTVLLGGHQEVDFRTPSGPAIELDLLVDKADGAIAACD